MGGVYLVTFLLVISGVLIAITCLIQGIMIRDLEDKIEVYRRMVVEVEYRLRQLEGDVRDIEDEMKDA